MKLSEIGRYWTAKELTEIKRVGNQLKFYAPFACPNFTLSINGQSQRSVQLRTGSKVQVITSVTNQTALKSGTYCANQRDTKVCVDLPKGESTLTFT